MTIIAKSPSSFTATMTLKSDTEPARAYVKSPRGTLYWGGAGLDGGYIQPTLQALQRAGIKNVSVGLTNTATRLISDTGMIVDAIRAGLTIRYADNGEWIIGSGMAIGGDQFNLIGYSYVSLLAAQTANFYANQGVKVDHLVLIASPIDADFLRKLKSHHRIHKVFTLDLTDHGDEIHAGMSQQELLRPSLLNKLARDMLAREGQGHFDYGHSVPELPKRLELLAEWLFRQGLK